MARTPHGSWLCFFDAGTLQKGGTMTHTQPVRRGRPRGRQRKPKLRALLLAARRVLSQAECGGFPEAVRDLGTALRRFER
jgi:hypothetical protein